MRIFYILIPLFGLSGAQAPPDPAADPAAAAPPAPDPGLPPIPVVPIGPQGNEFNKPVAWLRLCRTTSKYLGVVRSGQNNMCTAGYWFQTMKKVGCACGHGVWVLARGWCDPKARIIVARNGSCFSINDHVRYIRHLGWGHHAFMPYHFVATSGMEYVQTVPETLTMSNWATHFHWDYDQHVGAVFRSAGVESMTGRFCYGPEGNVSRPFSLKYFVPKLPFHQKRGCFGYAGENMKRLEYDAGYDFGERVTLIQEPMNPFIKPPSPANIQADQKCAKQCTSPESLKKVPRGNNSLAPDYVDPLQDEYFLDELKDMGWTNATSPPSELPEQKCEEVRQYNLTDKTTLEIKEQTKRMIQANLLYALKATPAPAVNFSDYNLMQKARKVLAKVCPQEELSITVLTGLHRMFRVALNESFFHYPFHQLGDDAETNKIAEALETCYNTGKPMTFVYERPKTPGNDTNATAPATPPPPMSADKCTTGKYLGVQYEFSSATPLNRTILSKLPCSLWSNITDLDLVIETAWKTVMFSHYYCARHFNNDSVLFSVFEQKMERFFNRWIQHRWFYPGPALQAYKYIFQMFDLEKFAKSLDRCVATARSFSIYRKWIKRPVYAKYLGGKLFEEQYEIRNDIASKEGLDAIRPILTEFNKTAYCLPYWHAPASNPGLNYNPAWHYKKGCVRFRKEEWKDAYTPKLNKWFGWRDTTNFV